jgi:hypothetical protein
MSEPNNPLNVFGDSGHHHHHDDDETPPPAHKLDLPGVRALLEKSHGKEYWRSLEDLA